MKKKRLLSWLLTAALAVSSLPVMAVSAEEADSENLLAGATITAADGTTVSDGVLTYPAGFNADNPNGEYMSVVGRAFDSTSGGFNLEYVLTADDITHDLVLAMDVRHSQPAMTWEDSYGDFGETGFEYASSRFRIYYGSTKIGDKTFAPAKNDGTWNTVTVPLTGNYKKAGNFKAEVYKGYGGAGTHNMDVDNIRIYYLDADNNEVCVFGPITENFLTYTEDGKKAISTRTFANSVIEYTDGAYMVADSNAETNTEFDITLSKALQPGVYKLSGDFRLGIFSCDGYLSDGTYWQDSSVTGTANAYVDSANDAKIIVTLGTASANADIDTVWDSYEFEFVVTEATNKLSLVVDGGTDKVAEVQNINFKDLALELVSASKENIEAETEENLLDGAEVDYHGIPATVEAAGHLVIGERNYRATFAKDKDGNWTNNVTWSTDAGAKQEDIHYNNAHISSFAAITLPVTVKKGTEYIISFDTKCEPVTYTRPDGVDVTWNTLAIRPSLSGTIEESANRTPWATDANEVTFDNNRTYTLTTSEQRFEASFTPKADSELKVWINKGSGEPWTNAFTIDNLRVTTADGTELYFNDFGVPAEAETYEETDASNGGVKVTHYKVTTNNAVIDNKGSVAVVDCAPGYTAVTPFNSTDAAKVTYDTSALKTETGAYTFTVAAASETAGTADLIVTLNNGKTVKVEDIALSADFTDITCTFNVEKGVVIENIELVTDIKGTIMVASPSLTFIPPADDDGGMPNVGIVMMMLLKKRAGEGGGVTSPLSVNGKPLATTTYAGNTANKYLTVYNSIINTNGIAIAHSGLAAGKYTLEFDIRQTVDLQRVGEINFKDNESGDVIRVRDSFAGAVQKFLDFNEDGSWKHYSYEFSADGAKAYSVAIYGGTNQTYSMPFEIDNIVIKDSKGEVVYTQNFDAVELASYTGKFSIAETAANGATFTITQRSADISDYAIVTDDSYISATTTDNAVVTYSLGETVLAAGEYVFKGSIRNGYFDGSHSGKESASLDDAKKSDKYLNWLAADAEVDGKTVTKGLFVVNKNKMAVKVTATVGETVTAADYTVASNWTDFEVKFTVAAGQTPVLTFTLDHDMPYTIDGKGGKVPFDLKNVEIVAAK